MSIENVKRITVPSTEEIATVGAWPGEVSVAVHTLDGNLTLDQARDLAREILLAADRAEGLDFIEDEDGNFRLVEKQKESN